MKVMTYASLILKYPDAKEDILLLQESKNQALRGFALVFFILGIITGYLLSLLP